MLVTLTILLAAILLSVPLTRWLGFGSVLGYLVAGIAIGPFGLRIVSDIEQISGIAQLGVIMLMFLIGLELRPQRLWIMRKAVFLLGSSQVVLTGAILSAIGAATGLLWPQALVLGFGFALSSTATVLPMLAERDLLGSQAGRDAFSVLLFQDLAFLPLVTILPLLGDGSVPDRVPWIDVAQGAGAIALILIGGRFLLRPLLTAIAALRTPEVFTALALIIVVGTALLCEEVGLSASLGAFLAGVLLSDSQYRHELQADIAPFEGLLLGFFFISVGMEVDVALAFEHPAALILGVLAVIAVKITICYGLARIGRRSAPQALRFALALPEGSEFSFVLFGAAVSVQALPSDVSDFATLVVAASILATPILFAASEALLMPRIAPRQEPRYDQIEEAEPSRVIICGFGRVGQIVGRVLRLHRIPFTALDTDAEQVEAVRQLGRQVFYGDPTRLDLLRAAGAEHASVLVIALADMEKTVRIVDLARREFPHLKILARARNRFHVHQLMDRKVEKVVRDTYHSSLKLSELVLGELGVPAAEAKRALTLFHEHDERHLKASHAVYRDEKKSIQSARDATVELEAVFQADRHERKTAAD